MQIEKEHYKKMNPTTIGRRYLSTLLVSSASLVVVMSLTAWGARHDHRQADQGKNTTHLFGNHSCPISGEPVVPETFVPYKDEANNIYGRLYLCCKGCTKKTKKKVADLYKKFYRTDPKTGKAIGPRDLKNATCPISGDPVTKKDWIEYNGMIVHFCCRDCVKDFLKNPDSYLKKIVPNPDDFKYEKPAGSGSAK